MARSCPSAAGSPHQEGKQLTSNRNKLAAGFIAAAMAMSVPAHAEDDEAKVDLPPPCPDMTLVSPACGFTKGYRVLVGNPGSEYADDDDAGAGAGEVYYVLEAYFNAAPNRAGTGGGARGTTAYKRVKL